MERPNTPFIQTSTSVRLGLFAALFIGALCLAVLYILSAESSPTWPGGMFLVRFFDLNQEANLPSWYSGCLWLIGAFVSWRAAMFTRADRAFRREHVYWMTLAAGCVLLSLDEVGSIHEAIGDIIGQYSGRDEASSPVYFWIWAGLAVVGVCAAAYAHFLFILPRAIGIGLIASGAIFLIGAMGFETLGSLVQSGTIRDFPAGLGWTYVIALEETTEMIGVILFAAVVDWRVVQAARARRVTTASYSSSSMSQ